MHALGADGQPVHLVGHSLGGLLALRACLAADLPSGRVVCLGSPLKGSAAARSFSAWGRGGEVLLGHNRELLEQGFDCWTGPRQVGVIAGRTPLGLGAVLGHLDGEHDGTVAVEETRLPGLTGHCVVEANHTGLLFSADVAQRAGHFLRDGHFPAG
jgi:pimeloyl-ACP methyl ester carboxylesterase